MGLLKGVIYPFLHVCIFQSRFLAFLETTLTPCYAFSERSKFYSFQYWQNSIKKIKWGRARAIPRGIIRNFWKNNSLHVINILWFFFSVDESYYYLTRICQKNVLMTSLMKNDQKCELGKLFLSYFLDITYQRVWCVMVEKNFVEF